MTDYWKSAIDSRHKRSMVEWYNISKYAEEKSVREARKKYYGKTLDGNKIYLHPITIKKKINEMKGFKISMQHYIMHSLAD